MVKKNEIYEKLSKEEKERQEELWRLDNNQEVDNSADGELITFREQLRMDFKRQGMDNSWYELYKSITNEKDLAEKDQ